MLGVLVNCGAILIGSVIGLLFSKKFTQELSDLIQTASGVVTVIIGLQMAFSYSSIVYLSLSLIIGGIIGYALDIDGFILKIGILLQRIFFKGSASSADSALPGQRNFAYAFLNASVLFCVGAMAIIGSFKAGVEHDYTILFTKSILDGFMAVSFAAAMGCGTAFSAIMIFLYQGVLVLLSSFIQPYVSQELITEVSACGGAIIVMIGINILGLKKIKTANFLPALILQILFVIFVPLVKGLFQ